MHVLIDYRNYMYSESVTSSDLMTAAKIQIDKFVLFLFCVSGRLWP
jgi:hypothetical protein